MSCSQMQIHRDEDVKSAARNFTLRSLTYACDDDSRLSSSIFSTSVQDQPIRRAHKYFNDSKPCSKCGASPRITRHLLRIAVDECNTVVGGVEIDTETSLSTIRDLIIREIDASMLPSQFVFMYQGAPVSSTQECKRLARHCLPQLQIRSVNFFPFASKIELKNSLCVLFSVPLVFCDEYRRLRELPSVAHQQEREVLQNAFSSRKKLQIRFDFANSHTLREALSRGYRCVHFSGHATANALVLEDEYGGAHLLDTVSLQALLRATVSSLPALVFVAACSSRSSAMVFVEAGVRHVVAIESDARVRDRAMTLFSGAFYRALVAQGHTVSTSYQLALEAMYMSPDKSFSYEASKFVLLPEDGEHNVVIFSDLHTDREDIERDDEGSDNYNMCTHTTVAATFLPVVSHKIVGRAADIYCLVSNIRRYRLQTVCGPSGVGLTTCALAAANFASERGYVHNRVLFLTASTSAANVLREAAVQLHIDCADNVFEYLHRRRVLIVLDGLDVEQCDVIELISQLLHRTQNVTLLVTCSRSLGPLYAALMPVGEKVHALNPLSPLDSARLFLQRAPRVILPGELDAKTPADMLRQLSELNLLTSLNGMPASIVRAAASVNKRLCPDSSSLDYGLKTSGDDQEELQAK